jgi:DNA recombination protein RmuC
MSPIPCLLLGAFAGAVLGFLLGWLLGRGRATAPDDRLANELRQQLAQREAELAKVRDQAAAADRGQAAAEASRAAAEKLAADQRALHEKALRDAKEAQDQALADLRAAFKALSVDTLRELQPQFIERVTETVAKLQETAKGDLAQRQEAIKTLVEPLKQQLETYQKRLQQAETSQAGALGEVKKQLEQLSQHSDALARETTQFRQVLTNNQARGRWGEETLRRVVEAAGMSPHCDFVEQSAGDEGKPDLIVKLPEERVIIVDAKVPDLDVVSATGTAEPGRRADLLAAHASKLRQTIKNLSERNYPQQFPRALDHVVLFLPAESLFSTALEGDPDLIVWAESKRVYLATPASFIAVLRTIDFIWQQHKQTVHAQEIAEAAQDFYGRVVTFIEHFEKIRAGLDRANTAFNAAQASFQTRVRPAGERLKELGGGVPGKELADLPPLGSAPQLPPGS